MRRSAIAVVEAVTVAERRTDSNPKQTLTWLNKITTHPQYEADVWKYVGFQLKNEFDKDNAVCKLCLAAVKYCRNTMEV